MQRNTKITMICIAITLNILGIVNIATIANVLELRLALRVAWITTWSWAMVWLCGMLVAYLVIGEGNGRDTH